MSKQTEIKSFLLANYPFYHNGYCDVVSPDGSNIYLDKDKQKYVGINDFSGNFFYIRDLKDVSYEPIKRGARVQYYDAIHKCKIVCITINTDEDIVLKSLINAISLCGSILLKSDTESTRVFKNETGKELIKKEYNIISCEFEYHEILNTKDCSLNPCIC